MSSAERDALLEHADRLEPEQHARAGSSRTRGVAHDDRVLPEPSRDRDRRVDRRLRRRLRADDLEQRHHRDRVEEVHADDELRTARRRGDLPDRQRRRVGREDRVRRGALRRARGRSSS